MTPDRAHPRVPIVFCGFCDLRRGYPSVRLTDRGRPISDLTDRLGYEDLRRDAEVVLSRLIPVERELRDDTGRWYLTRVLPYRSAADRIEGIAITFIDITTQKNAEEALRASEEQLSIELESRQKLHALVSRLLTKPDIAAALRSVLLLCKAHVSQHHRNLSSILQVHS